MAAAVNKQEGLIEIAFFTSGSVKLGQGYLNFRVTAHALNPQWAEHIAHVIGSAQRNFYEWIILTAPDAQACNCGLDQMPVVIKFVPHFEVYVAGTLTGVTEFCVEIAIGLLACGDQFN